MEKKMGLGLPTGGNGDFIPYIKFNATSGRWFIKSDDGDKEVKSLKAVIDLHNIQTGEFKFMAGQAPVLNFDSSLGACDAQGGENFKRGFRVYMFAKALDGLREFAANSNAGNEAMNDLYSAFEAAPEAKAGKYPVVECTDIKAIENKNGTNYRPVLEIVKWVDKPTDFPESVAASPSQAAAAEPSAAFPADDDDDEF
jgi:hypothetical protein